MRLSDLLKRIIDTFNYNEMVLDENENINYVCQIVEPLKDKNIPEIQDDIITPLLAQYRSTDDTNEMKYINETIMNIIEYIAD